MSIRPICSDYKIRYNVVCYIYAITRQVALRSLTMTSDIIPLNHPKGTHSRRIKIHICDFNSSKVMY